MVNQDTSINNQVDSFTRARELKAKALQEISILQSAPGSSKHRTRSINHEDTLINTLRTTGKSWSDITTCLNERRTSSKEEPIWTEAVVYSRFILNNSATATPSKEVGFESRDYAHLRNVGSGREGTSKAGKKRVKDFRNATELSANIRTPAALADVDESSLEKTNNEAKIRSDSKVKAKGKDEERRKGGTTEESVRMDAGMVEALMRAVAKVNRNFWVFVADEMEREAGKFIEPNDLEEVYHNI